MTASKQQPPKRLRLELPSAAAALCLLLACMVRTGVEAAGDIRHEYFETQHASWFERLGDSFTGVAIGFLFLIVASVLLVWSEGRAVRTHQSLVEGKGQVRCVDRKEVDPKNEGKLIHLQGTIKNKDGDRVLKDKEFGIALEGALKLRRKVEVYHWTERSEKVQSSTHVGGSQSTTTKYSYHAEWSSSVPDSHAFHDRGEHANPPKRFEDATITCGEAAVGAFKASPSLLSSLSNWEKVELLGGEGAAQGDHFKYAMQGLFASKGITPHILSDQMYIGYNPNYPQIGDHRITFEVCKKCPVSIVAQQCGKRLAPFHTKAGGNIELLENGHLSADRMFEKAISSNATLTWVLRFVGALIMFFGFSLLLGPAGVLADVIPLVGSLVRLGTFFVAFFGSLVVSLSVIALAWLWYRPLFAAGLLLISFVLSAVLFFNASPVGSATASSFSSL